MWIPESSSIWSWRIQFSYILKLDPCCGPPNTENRERNLSRVSHLILSLAGLFLFQASFQKVPFRGVYFDGNLPVNSVHSVCYLGLGSLERREKLRLLLGLSSI